MFPTYSWPFLKCIYITAYKNDIFKNGNYCHHFYESPHSSVQRTSWKLSQVSSTKEYLQDTLRTSVHWLPAKGVLKWNKKKVEQTLLFLISYIPKRHSQSNTFRTSEWHQWKTQSAFTCSKLTTENLTWLWCLYC